MLAEVLFRVEVPVFTGEFLKLLVDSALSPGLVPGPAGLTPSLGAPGEAGHGPEAAGGRDRAEAGCQEAPGDDELVSVPGSPGLHQPHLLSETSHLALTAHAPWRTVLELT